MAYVGPSQRYQGVYCHEHWTTVGYPLLSSSYDYKVRDLLVEATLTETYQAQTNVEREVSYIFEVPPEASVVGFFAQIGDTLVQGIVDEKAEADAKYQQARSAGVQAWKLDKIHEEVFQISLGNVAPNSSIKVHVNYVYLISSDTIERSARLTIPCGLAPRPGGSGPATYPTPSGSDAVTITVGIEGTHRLLSVHSLSHNADITPGFSDKSFKSLTSAQRDDQYNDRKYYVEFKSNQFFNDHFVLVWTAPRLDAARCIIEELEPPIHGKPRTTAFALTLVSNVDLEPEEHEYIFLVDKSGSMSGSRIQTANEVVKTMLHNLPNVKRSTFNIYAFNTTAKSILADGRSLGHDEAHVSSAISRLNTNTGGGTDINSALTTVFSQRNASMPRCSVIVISDGLDWGVTTAMQTVQKNAQVAAEQGKLLRVFVMGLGNSVSRGMCEALARAGAGATAYISESGLQEHDHRELKAFTMINSINRAPIRVRSIDWGMKPASGPPQASGNNLDYRPQPKQTQLGPAAKGNNLPPPEALQQAPRPGTMFWAVRSYWYAIIDGTEQSSEVKIEYDIPGRANSTRTIEVPYRGIETGRLVHRLAARALIQTLEDKAVSITDPTERYWNECEVVRLGKTYSLASTQTSFVATMNGVGTCTKVVGNAPPSSFIGNTSNLDFVSTRNEGVSSAPSFRGDPNMVAASSSFMNLAVRSEASQDAASDSGDGEDDLSDVIAAQDGDGAFDPAIVEAIIFQDAKAPALPVSISALQGRDRVKHQIWLAVCVIAFFQKKYAADGSEWSPAKSKAEKFVKTTLCCIYGLDSGRSEDVFTKSLDEAAGYF